MIEWLTTGQMIDRLKVGEVAEIVEGKELYAFDKVKKYDKGNIAWLNRSVDFQLTESHAEVKWRILPKYVSFEEAMKAVNDYKKVTYQVNDDQPVTIDRNSKFSDLAEGLYGCSVEDLWMHVKWTIEGD